MRCSTGILCLLAACADAVDPARPDPAARQTAPTIVEQPQSQTIQRGQRAMFKVRAAGSAPLSYQWRRGGVTIPGATDTMFVVAAAAAADSGASFSVTVTNPAGAVTSSNAELVVVSPAAATLSLSRDSVVIGTWGDTLRMVVTVRDQSGNVMPGVPVAWSSSDTSIATVDAQGLVMSRRAGSAVITASAGSLSAKGQARIQLQMNGQCKIPAGTPSRRAVGGAPTFVSAPGAFNTDLIGRHVSIREPIPLDFDRDGDQDLIVLFFQNPDVKPYQGGVAIWRNDGGRFVTASNAAVLGTTADGVDAPRQYEVADFNGDGVSDIFVAQHGYDAGSFPGAPNLLFLSQANGGIREVAATNLVPNDIGYTHGSASGDWDCDGDIDLLAINSAYNHFSHLYVNSGSGRFTADDKRIPDELQKYPYTTFSAVGCDFDRDGDPDIYVGGTRWREAYFLINDGFGRFRFAPPFIAVPNSRYGRKEHVVESRCADMNLDGWPDLVLGSDGFDRGDDGSYGVFLNKGDWVFEDVTARLVPTGWELPNDWYWRMRPIDMNADGWPDLLPVTNHGNNVLLLNQGPDRPFQVVRLPARYTRHVDADGDGRPDIITTGWFSNGQEGRPELWLNR